MGCNTSTHVVNAKTNSPQTKPKQDVQKTPNKEFVKNNSGINVNGNNHGLDLTDQIPNPKLDCESETQNNAVEPSMKMSAQVGIMGPHEIASSSISKESNPVKDSADKEKKIARANDTNNNSGSENAPPVIEEHYNDEDDFDTARAPLSRTDMLKKRHLETQDTLEFVYKNSTKIAPPAGADPFLSVSNPNFGNRMNHRRGSGVPPPPRALQSTDFLARRAAGADLVMEEADEENV